MTNPIPCDLAPTIIATSKRRREEIVSLCARLVAARSVNPEGDTREVASVVFDALAALGLIPRIERQIENMPSVIAEIDSGRPGPHLILNVHIDTMPPGDESAWTVPIWELTRRDGRLYGLGMGNMKGAVAAMIHTAGILHDHRDAWAGRVTFTAVSDEVVFGDNGAAYLLREHSELYGDGLLCGEGPGYKKLAIGEKGVLWLQLGTRAEGGHSSAVHQGRSASARMAAAVTAVDALNGKRAEAPADLAPHFEPDSDLGFELTANVGLLRSGTFVGQIAIEGHAEVDLRLPPGIPADVAQGMVETAVGSEVTVHRLKGWDPNWTSPNARLAECWASASHLTGGGEPRYAIRLPASDASRWRQKGISALCYGPQPTLSAGIDDYAEEDEVLHCVGQYTLTALTFLGAPSTEETNS